MTFTNGFLTNLFDRVCLEQNLFYDGIYDDNLLSKYCKCIRIKVCKLALFLLGRLTRSLENATNEQANVLH